MTTHRLGGPGVTPAAFALAAALAWITAAPVPSLEASGAACQAGPDSGCCTCGIYQGEPFCKPHAPIGGVVCDDGYCPRRPVCSDSLQ